MLRSIRNTICGTLEIDNNRAALMATGRNPWMFCKLATALARRQEAAQTVKKMTLPNVTTNTMTEVSKRFRCSWSLASCHILAIALSRDRDIRIVARPVRVAMKSINPKSAGENNRVSNGNSRNCDPFAKAVSIP